MLHVLYSFDVGGLEKGIATLINNASPEFEHMILCLSHSGESKQLISDDIPIFELHKPPGNSVSFCLKLAKSIYRIQPDIVHTRNWGGIDGAIAARLAGCSCVVHGEHGWDIDDPHGSSLKKKLVRRYLSLGIKEFTVVSQQIENWLENDVRVFRPVNCIYNGVDILSDYCLVEKGSLRKELNLSDSATLVGTVGRLDPIKDQAGLISAFVTIKKKIPQCHLIVVGDGSEKENLENITTDGVHLLGMRSDVMDILSSLDLFVLPSLNEGISNTILEAMAAGLPVVATDVGGTPEMIQSGYNGFLVQPHDYPALIDAQLTYLLNPQLMREHGVINRSVVKEKFTIQKMVSEYESVWKRVVNTFSRS